MIFNILCAVSVIASFIVTFIAVDKWQKAEKEKNAMNDMLSNAWIYSDFELLADDIMKISGASNWKCRLCAYAKTGCNKKTDCKEGIEKFFTDEVTDNER